MKLTKKQEAEVLKAYKAYWEAYLNGDMKAFASMLDDDITVFGTAVSEVFTTKKETLKFYKATADQLVGKAQFRNRQFHIKDVDDNVLINEQGDLYFLIDGKWTFYGRVRVTAILKQTKSGWKLIHQHASFPDIRAEEGEQVAAEKIKEENLQLRDAVKRRTAELENKNRELEIETSLEKVRAVAMGMGKPENFPDVCEVLFKELQSLGFNELRNAMVNIHNDEKRSFVNYDYSDEIGKSITPLVYDEHPVIKKQIKQIRKADDAFSESVFKGKDLEDWKTFRKSRGEKNDKRIRNIKALYYYFYSIGTGSIGISTFDKINEEKKDVLKRFRNVFAFAYRRYMDVAQAEAQAKEARVELALERVRARAMAMHNSSELAELVSTVFNELTQLDFKLTSCIIWIHDHENTKNTLWIASTEMNKPAEPFLVNPFHNDFFKSISHAWKSKDTKWVYTFTGKEKKNFEKAFFKEIPQLPIHLKNALKVPEQVVFSASFNNFGALEIVETEALTEEKFEILHRFGKVFNSSYTRFNDLQKAEAQAREAKIEAALEKVRSRTMAMQKSNELTDVAGLLFEQVSAIGIKTWTAGFNVWSEDNNSYVDYITSPQGGFIEPYTVYTETAEALTDISNARKSGVEFDVQYVEGEKIKQLYLALTKLDEKQYEIMLQDGVRFPSHQYEHFVFGSKVSLMFITYEPVPEAHDIFKRLGKVFEQTYTRFLDLKKAEAQAREAQIETGLERVRSKTMAMHKSDEVTGIAVSLNEELMKLGFEGGSTIIIIDKETGDTEQWTGFSKDKTLQSCYVPYFKHPYHDVLLDAWKKEEKFLVYTLTGEEKKTIDEHYFATGYNHFPESDKKWMRQMGSVTFSHAFMKYGAIHWGPDHLTEEQLRILQRFSKVFEQSYTRFLDLQKAESQAREAQIEAALERVRSRSMAMHKSDDLHEVIKVVTEQLSVLGLKFNVANFAKIDPDGSWDIWLSTPDQTYPALIHVPYLNHPLFNDIIELIAKNKDFYTGVYTREEANIFFHHFFENTIAKNTPEERKQFLYRSEGFARSIFLTKNIWFSVARYDATPFIGEENAIFKRFANVFEQAYTRFLDLQKAEAQAREAQIEASLERVRSRAMAMQNSDELKELIGTVFTELTKLDIVLTRCLIMIYDPRSNDSIWWMANSEAPTEPIGLRIQNHGHPPYAAYLKAWQEKKLNWVYVLEGAVKKDWDNFLFVETELSHLPDFVIAGMKAPERVYLNSSFNSFGNLTLATLEPLSNEHFDILLRFAKVFDLTYTRFNDLKQAEAQTKEARIEAALERVRSRSMAMHSPQELKDVALELRNQLGLLEQPELEVCAIHLYEESPDYFEAWAAVRPPGDEGRIIQVQAQFPKKGVKIVDEMFRQYESGAQDYILVNEGEKVPEWLNVLKQHTPEGYKMVIQSLQGRSPEDTRAYWSMADFKGGSLIMTTYIPPSDDARKLLRRFANVFGLAYRRFIDLKNAETQKREAQIELALERVRARTMAMHKSEELAETAQVLFQQLSELGGIPDRISIGIADETNAVVNFWTTDQEGSRLSHSFSARLNERTTIAKTYQAWKEHKKSLVVDLHGEELKEWIQFAREEMGIAVKDDQIKDRRVHSLAFFSHGWILVSSHEPQSTETIQILERFASVFNLTYRRFLDLQKAEAQANEARIEIALERIRARALAMHKSDELMEVAKVLREQMALLGQPELEASVVHLYEEDPDHILSWRAFRPTDSHGKIAYGHMSIPKNSCEFVREWLTKFYSEEKEYTIELSGTKQEEWYDLFFTLAPDVINSMRKEKSIHEKRYYQFSKFSGGALLMVSKQEPSAEVIYLQKRAAVVFDLAYRRFSDLQKTEAQAREAQIEVSLERVRAKAMAMHSSEDLAETIGVFYRELKSLSVIPIRCGVALMDKETRVAELTTMNTTEQGDSIEVIGKIKMAGHPVLDGVFENWLVQKEYHAVLRGNQIKEYYKVLKPQISYPDYSHDDVQFGYYFMFNEGDVYAWTETELPENDLSIYRRFTSVISLTYKRYKDLKQAEAQAKEAQIEASLERVRSKTMAMHNSQDVGNTVATMFDQLVHLGVKTNRCGILIFSDTNHTEVWTAKSGSTGEAILIIGHLDVTIHPMLQRVHHAWTNKETFISYELAGDDIKNYYNAINNYPDYPTRFNLDNLPSREIHSDFFFPEGAVFSFTSEPVPEEEALIFKRFAGVFGQTYRRYLDLQKAEANAREAQIEAGLERVRARTMAMHSSEDVSIATATMFTELEKLGIENFRGGITNIIPNRTQHVWSVNNLEEGKVLKSVGTFNIDAHPFWQLMYKEWESKKDFIHYYLAGEDKQYYFEVLNAIQGYLPQNFQQYPDLHFQVYYFNEGAVWTNSLQPHSEEDKQVMKRFTSVFSLTFRRYQDLKKAEAQAREATIEAALEKVRGKAMAMHNSNDLSVTTSMIITELGKLGIKPIRSGVGIINKETHKGQLYTARFSSDGDTLSVVGWVLLEGHPVLENIYEKWIQGEDYFPELSGDSRKNYYEQLLAGLSVPIPDFKDEQIHYGHFFSFSVGCLYAWSEVKYNDDEIKILKRFASIIDLTFRRYFELQKSEANAREAIKQAALDRIRADIASMRTINDLDRITPLIWNELTVLGIPFIRCGVFIMDEDEQLIHTFLSTPDGKAIAAFHLPYDTPGNLSHVISNWKIKNKYIDHWDEKEFIQFADILMKQGALISSEQYLKTIPKNGFYLHFLPFLQGMLYVGNTTQLNNDEIELIQHVADAFSTAYARYEDFNKLEAAKQQVENTLTDLKQAQTQLVQSEKMASLGELTAGIAHEIQNPLNFVNNFSEVSKELLDEMKEELATGNPQQAIEIAADVIQNLEKINHHGKRADAIVKSMLQHSRSGSSKKEPADINGLADEYLRLAYHGLRAKDKSFNAKFETEFDNNIGKINIISQDIGRVLVNLINNAFYAVSERKKQESNGYEPTVTVFTKKTDDKIEIRVKDNGNGIPQKVLDKIFQPFFTTKPTGQGTGLGLSLAYDIVTKGHGGELKVETKEGEGSEFIIQLPVSKPTES